MAVEAVLSELTCPSELSSADLAGSAVDYKKLIDQYSDTSLVFSGTVVFFFLLLPIRGTVGGEVSADRERFTHGDCYWVAVLCLFQAASQSRYLWIL